MTTVISHFLFSVLLFVIITIIIYETKRMRDEKLKSLKTGHLKKKESPLCYKDGYFHDYCLSFSGQSLVFNSHSLFSSWFHGNYREIFRRRFPRLSFSSSPSFFSSTPSIYALGSLGISLPPTSLSLSLFTGFLEETTDILFGYEFVKWIEKLSVSNVNNRLLFSCYCSPCEGNDEPGKID